MSKRGRARVLLRESDAYAPAAFRAGVTAIGYTLTDRLPVGGERDVLVVWNRRPTEEATIRQFESGGGRVVVAENGYLGRDADGGKLFALALGHHAGAGTWPVGDGSRWAALGLEIKPWRADGDDVVILGQRCIGEKGVAQPEGWPERVAREIAARTRRKVRIRPHPGMARPDPYEALTGAWAAVTWASGAGLKALLAGIPVFHGLASWIGSGAAAPYDPEAIEAPRLPDRLPMFERLAWAQWTRAEIARGEALACLLS